MAYIKYTGDIPEIEVPAEGNLNIETEYYIGLEKQDETLEFNNNLENEDDIIQNTFKDWCQIIYNRTDNTAKQIILQTKTNKQEQTRECIITFYNSDFPEESNDTKIKVIQQAAQYNYAYYDKYETLQNTNYNSIETKEITNDLTINENIMIFKFGKKEIQNWIINSSNYSLTGILDNKNLNDYFTITYLGQNGEMGLRLKSITTWNYNKSVQGNIICNLNNNQYTFNLFLSTKQIPLTILYFAINQRNVNNITNWRFDIYINNNTTPELSGNLSLSNLIVQSNIFYDRTEDSAGINPQEFAPEGQEVASYAQIVNSNLNGIPIDIFTKITKIEINYRVIFQRPNNVSILTELSSGYDNILGSQCQNGFTELCNSGYIINARYIGFN